VTSIDQRSKLLRSVPLILMLGMASANGQAVNPYVQAVNANGPVANENHTAWWFGGGVDVTDNATLTPTPMSDTIGTIIGGIDLDERSRIFTAKLLGTGEFLHYFRHSFSNDWLGSAIGHLSYGPETVMWVVDGTFGQLSIDPSRAIIPTNRQDMSLYTTGPDFRVPLASDTNFVASLRYGQSHFQSTNYLNDDRATAMVGFEHHASATTMWGMNADAARVEYQETGNPTYERYDVFARLRQTGGTRETLNIDLGVNSIHGLGESQTAPMLRLDYLRRIAPRFSVTVLGDLQYQNVAEQASAGVVVSPTSLNPQNIIPTTTPFETATVGAGLHYLHTRTQFDLTGSYSDAKYIAQLPHRYTTVVDGRAIRRMTPLLTGAIHANYTRNSDQLPQYANTWKTADARLSYELGRDIFVDGGYRYTNQVFGIPGGNYHQSELFLLVSYRSPGAAIGLPGTLVPPPIQ
jgi:hypothetical protein